MLKKKILYLYFIVIDITQFCVLTSPLSIVSGTFFQDITDAL